MNGSESGDDAPDPLALAGELRPVLLRLARELRRETLQGMTPGQATVLARIREAPGIGVRRLAELEGVSAPNISSLIDRLERAGFVTRHPVPDRRRIGLSATAEGVRVLERVRSLRTAWLAARLARLSRGELTRVAAALDALRRVLDDEADHAPDRLERR
jgi:DNA-binding MarR family transcriptional regulator